MAQLLLTLGIRHMFQELFPDAIKKRKVEGSTDPYAGVIDHFETQELDLLNDQTDEQYQNTLNHVPGLLDLVHSRHQDLEDADIPVWAEFFLHGLAEHSRLGRKQLVGTTRFSDMMSSVFLGRGMSSGGEVASTLLRTGSRSCVTKCSDG